MKTYVHRNLVKQVWSVTQCGRVVAHSNRTWLRDVEFRVRPGGRARVLREGTKNVHAFGVGRLDPTRGKGASSHACLADIAYNPYFAPFFYDIRSGREVRGAEFASFMDAGQVWVTNPVYGDRRLGAVLLSEHDCPPEHPA